MQMLLPPRVVCFRLTQSPILHIFQPGTGPKTPLQVMVIATPSPPLASLPSHHTNLPTHHPTPPPYTHSCAQQTNSPSPGHIAADPTGAVHVSQTPNPQTPTSKTHHHQPPDKPPSTNTAPPSPCPSKASPHTPSHSPDPRDTANSPRTRYTASRATRPCRCRCRGTRSRRPTGCCSGRRCRLS